MDDTQRMIWIEQQAMRSPTGISFDYVPAADGDPSGFRFMRQHSIGKPHRSIREAIDAAVLASATNTDGIITGKNATRSSLRTGR